MKSRNQREGHYCGKNSGIPFIAFKNTKNGYKLRRRQSASHQRNHPITNVVSSDIAWDRVLSKQFDKL